MVANAHAIGHASLDLHYGLALNMSSNVHRIVIKQYTVLALYLPV